MASDQNSSSERTQAFDLDRTISLSDGIFAFALTLLVLSISVPEIAASSSSSELWTALKERQGEIISYLISFAVIGGFWIRHHKFCGMLKSVDGPFLVINLIYLATIAFIPYPTQLLGDFGNAAAFSFYAAAISISILASAALNEHALHSKLFATPRTRDETKEVRISGGLVAAGFIVSIPIVLLTNDLWLGYLCWFIGPNVRLLRRERSSGEH
ncbi:unannotated protein [freshwater metagenome]|uniref:Unannotated protein n=1 Tax=freshwater metagenome TaxID=449393 RepID=A0A6J7RJ52_9ZZZZ